jgi:hypothetical protein
MELISVSPIRSSLGYGSLGADFYWMRAIQYVAEELWALEYLVGQVREKNERLPQSLEELVKTQSVPRAMVDPSGEPSHFNKKNRTVKLSPKRKVRLLEVPESYKNEFRITISPAAP